MYTIFCNRRLYKYEDGKYKTIKRDEVFEEQTISVFIQSIRLSRYRPTKYIEKKIEFNQGSGSYELVNCQPTMELICQALKVITPLSMLMAMFLLEETDNSHAHIPPNLVLVSIILWFVLLFVQGRLNGYLLSNYERYVNESKLIKL